MNTTTNLPPFRFAFSKDSGTTGFLICLFSYIDKAKSEISHIEKAEGGYRIVKKTNPDEIVKLKIDYSLVDDKIFNWFDERTNLKPLELTHEESKTFVQLVHAAHWFVTEQNHESINPNFLTYYEHIVKKAKENGL